jgi:hypothetical protein
MMLVKNREIIVTSIEPVLVLMFSFLLGRCKIAAIPKNPAF